MRLSIFLPSLLWTLIGLGLVACEKDATIPPPPATPKLVMVCFLSPEADTLQVSLTWSKPIFATKNPGDPVIRNATVRLQGPGVDVVLPFVPLREQYELETNSLSLVGGEIYTLTATEPGGNQVKAQTRIPEKRDWEFQATIYDSSQSAFMSGWTYFFRVQFRDPGPDKSHYRVGAYFRTLQYLGEDSVGEFWQPIDYSLNDRFYESGQNPGQVYDIRLSQASEFQGNPDEEKVYSFHLLSVNQDYLEYHTRLFNFQGDNPFAEAQTLYSNVNGGLGIFAAYRENRIEIRRP